MERPDSWRRAPGWYPDPDSPEGLRWWDGTRWIRQAVPDNPATGNAPSGYYPTPAPYVATTGSDSGWAQYSPAAPPPEAAAPTPVQETVGPWAPPDLWLRSSARSWYTPEAADEDPRPRGCLRTLLSSRLSAFAIAPVLLVTVFATKSVPLGFAITGLIIIVGVAIYIVVQVRRARRARDRRGSRTTSSRNKSSPTTGVVQPLPDKEIMGELKATDLNLPLSEQYDVAGENSHRRDIKAIFAEAGSPVTATGTILEGLSAVLRPYSWGSSYGSLPASVGDVIVMVGERHVGNLPRTVTPKYYPLIVGFATQGIAVACQLRLWARAGERGFKAQATVNIPSVDDLTKRLENPAP